MSDVQKNKAVCLKFYEHVCAREYDKAMQLLDQDVIWWTNGTLPFSGTHNGREAVTELFGLLKDSMPEGLKVTFGAITAEDDRVTLEMVSDGKLTNGLNYNNSYHFLFWIQNGLIKRCHEYLDTLYTHNIFNAKSGTQPAGR